MFTTGFETAHVRLELTRSTAVSPCDKMLAKKSYSHYRDKRYSFVELHRYRNVLHGHQQNTQSVVLDVDVYVCRNIDLCF